MRTYTKRPENIREGGARAVRLSLCANHDYLTFAGECSCVRPAVRLRFAVIGTDYGWIHNSAGDIRIFSSASGAYAAARRYRQAREGAA